MIARLRGELLESAFTACVIDAGGVGYAVAIPISTFDKLPPPGSPVTLLVHTQVREDAISLFGFATAEERDLFRILINVSGIGSKLALNILSSMPVPEFCSAVVNGDIKMLSRISGIGKRTAERLIVELRERLSTFGGGTAAPRPAGAKATAAGDAALALEQLGFKRDAVDKVLRQLLAELPESECDCETLLRRGLLLLNF
jgi:Holliday junction DNA helicase RuvA